MGGPKDENNEDWVLKMIPCIEPQDSPSSSGSAGVAVDVDIEEGMSVDESHQSSTNLSLEHHDDNEPEILGSIELVNTMNGTPNSSSYNGTGRKKPSSPMQIEVENMEDIARNFNSKNRHVEMIEKTPPPKAPPGSLDFGPISPDSSKGSQDILMKTDSGRKKSIRFSPTNEIRHFTPNPDEFDENPYMNQQQMSCGKKARLFLAVYALPFMHGASSNITTLYLLVELTLRYKIDTLVVGGYLALAYTCRLLLAFLNRVLPKTCVFVGSFIAYVGFGLIYLSQNDLIMQDFGLQGREFTLFLLGSVLANTNEMTSAMQIFVRDQVMYNVKEMGQKLKRHYLIAKLARVVSFGGGGVLYHYYGVEGLAILGGGMVALQIICLGVFYILDIYREVIDQSNGLYGEMKPPKRFAMDCSIQAAIGRRRMFSSSMSKLNRTLAKYYPTAMPSKIVNIILPICVYGRTIASMIIWNTIAFIMRDDFQQSFLVIGGVFAGMMFCDLIMTLVTISDDWNVGLKTNFPSPQDLYLLTIGMTLSLALVAVPSFIAFLVGLAAYICFNNAMRTLLFELQGNNDTVWDTLRFHSIRYFSTAAALYSIPVLNSFHKRLPLVLAIWFALLTSTTLVYFINANVREEEETDELDRKRSNALSTARSGRISRRPEKNLVYAEQIMLSRLIKGKEV